MERYPEYLEIVSHPVLSNEASYAWEAQVLGGSTRKTRAIVKEVGKGLAIGIEQGITELREIRQGDRILVLVGTGHNGADALWGVYYLKQKHIDLEVDVLFSSYSHKLKALCREAWEALSTLPKVSPITINSLKPEYLAWIDGILGIGGKGVLKQDTKSWMDIIETKTRVSLRGAVDLPSGVISEGFEGLRADITWATGIAKEKVFHKQSTEYAGRLRYVDVGFFDAEMPSNHSRNQIIIERNLLQINQLRDTSVHKYKMGHLLVNAGSMTSLGALAMVLRGAWCSGVGMVTAVAREDVALALAGSSPETLWITWEKGDKNPEKGVLDQLEKRRSKISALAMGTGLEGNTGGGKSGINLLSNWEQPGVLDASLLTRSTLEILKKRPNDWGQWTLTPHDGEMNTMGLDYEGLRNLTEETEHVVLSKGMPCSVIHEGTAYWVPAGGPILARAGSGDILTGLIGGLIAQYPEQVFESVALGALWQNIAADAWARDKCVRTEKALGILPYLSKVIQ